MFLLFIEGILFFLSPFKKCTVILFKKYVLVHWCYFLFLFLICHIKIFLFVILQVY